MNKKVAIVILNWNSSEDTIECLESLYQIKYSKYDVILLDNNSQDDSIKKIEKYCSGKTKVKSNFFNYNPHNKPIIITKYSNNSLEKEKIIKNNINSNYKQLILIENDKNYGFAEGNNIGIEYALKNLNPDYILLLNNDTVVDKNFLNELVKFAEKNVNTGFLGPKAYYYDKSNFIQFTGGGTINFKRGVAPAIFSNEIDRGQHDKFYEAEWIGGACLLCKKEVLIEIGLLDPKYYLCWEEVDLCLRGTNAGYKCYYSYKSKIWHKGGISSNLSPTSLYYGTRNTFYFLNKNATKSQYYLFITYFFLFQFWISTCVYLIYYHNIRLYYTFLKATQDGLKMASEVKSN